MPCPHEIDSSLMRCPHRAVEALAQLASDQARYIAGEIFPLAGAKPVSG
ncbi:hypothetical protein [Pseudomonas zhanjiangensis]|uniref:Uncharacterized protein n=1 Tax=Pseudomonas zhanjiangensis TaxID=3239015 RepID=A0ABV3YWB1_9PSED